MRFMIGIKSYTTLKYGGLTFITTMKLTEVCDLVATLCVCESEHTGRETQKFFSKEMGFLEENLFHLSMKGFMIKKKFSSSSLTP